MVDTPPSPKESQTQRRVSEESSPNSILGLVCALFWTCPEKSDAECDQAPDGDCFGFAPHNMDRVFGIGVVLYFFLYFLPS